MGWRRADKVIPHVINLRYRGLREWVVVRSDGPWQQISGDYDSEDVARERARELEEMARRPGSTITAAQGFSREELRERGPWGLALLRRKRVRTDRYYGRDHW